MMFSKYLEYLSAEHAEGQQGVCHMLGRYTASDDR